MQLTPSPDEETNAQEELVGVIARTKSRLPGSIFFAM